MTLPRLTIRRMMGLVALSALVFLVVRQGACSAPLAFAALLAIGVIQLVPRFHQTRPNPACWIGVFALGVAAPLFAAALINKEYWGYYLERPAVDRRILDVVEVESVSWVHTLPLGSGGSQFVPESASKIIQEIASGQVDPYYSLGERALIDLMDEGRLPPNPICVSDEEAAPLHRLIEATNLLESDAPGYHNARALSGAVIRAIGPGGVRLLFIGVRGGEVSNDHYPYYEFLFKEPPAGGKPELLSFQRFFFDVAGVEGIEWPAFFTMFSLAGLFVSLPVVSVLAILRRDADVRAEPNGASQRA
jgi:hypothetical protein